MNPPSRSRELKNQAIGFVSSRYCGVPKNPFSNGIAWEGKLQGHIRGPNPILSAREI